MAAYSGNTIIHSFHVSYAGCTDTGKVKKINEDNLLIMPMQGIFAVADGVGGLDAGEMASHIVLETIHDLMCEPPATEKKKYLLFHKLFFLFEGIFKKKEKRDSFFPVEEILDIANFRIIQHSNKKKMATTIVIAYLEKNMLKLINIGDSRGYIWRKDNLTQITNDHSLVGDLYRQGKITHEEMRTHQKRNIITNAIGNKLKVNPEYYSIDYMDNDIILLCTDGLTTMLPDFIINKIICYCKNDISKTATMLVDQANNRGGKDNITVVAFRLSKSCNNYK